MTAEERLEELRRQVVVAQREIAALAVKSPDYDIGTSESFAFACHNPADAVCLEKSYNLLTRAIVTLDELCE